LRADRILGSLFLTHAVRLDKDKQNFKLTFKNTALSTVIYDSLGSEVKCSLAAKSFLPQQQGDFTLFFLDF